MVNEELMGRQVKLGHVLHESGAPPSGDGAAGAGSVGSYGGNWVMTR
jgi:hypothetical protein